LQNWRKKDKVVACSPKHSNHLKDFNSQSS
jgi:hypothetical protein